MTPLRLVDLPPVWLIAAMAGAWALARWTPPPLSLPIPAAPTLGWAAIGAALALAVWAAATMALSRTTVMPRETPSAIVTGGPFRFSRNPIYLADALILMGWAGVIGSLWPVLLTPLFMVVIARRFIREEEASLKRLYPEDWAAWSARVRRWI